MDHWIFKTTDRKKLALDCLVYKLFIRGQELEARLKEILDENKPDRLMVAYFNQIPVGVMHKRMHYLMIYVHPNHRGKRLGSTLADRFFAHYAINPARCFFLPGNEASQWLFRQRGAHYLCIDAYPEEYIPVP